jgi:hypothetical protein
MGESKGFDRFLLLFRNAINLLDRPSLRILDLSRIQSARYLSQALFFCDREQNRDVGAVNAIRCEPGLEKQNRQRNGEEGHRSKTYGRGKNKRGLL